MVEQFAEVVDERAGVIVEVGEQRLFQPDVVALGEGVGHYLGVLLAGHALQHLVHLLDTVLVVVQEGQVSLVTLVQNVHCLH